MRSIFTTTLVIGITALTALTAQTKNEFQQDFDSAWRELASTYAYFDAKATAWTDVSGLVRG